MTMPSMPIETANVGSSPRPPRELGVALALERVELRTNVLTDIDIPCCYLARMRDEGLLAKLGYGRYRAAVPEVT